MQWGGCIDRVLTLEIKHSPDASLALSSAKVHSLGGVGTEVPVQAGLHSRGE